MSFDKPEKGIESLAKSVIRDLDDSSRPFCPCCKDDQGLLWRILTEYEPTTDAMSDLCSGFYDGHCECCQTFKFAIDRAYSYAAATNLDWREILATWEEHRDYWYMNYYQPANQPEPSAEHTFVFDDLDSFRSAVGRDGFICPACGKVSSSPYECSNDDCDWKSYGFLKCLGKGAFVFVKSEMRGETIFMPVAFAADDTSQSKAQIAVSIKPEYAERIFRGQKRYEFRRIRPRKDIDGMYIHVCGYGKQEIHGFAKVKGIIEASPDELWERCFAGAGIPRDDFHEYFAGYGVGYAIELESATRFDEPMQIKELGLKSTPQCMAYVKRNPQRRQ